MYQQKLSGPLNLLELVLVSAILVLSVHHPANAEEVHQTCPPTHPSTNATHETFRGLDVVWQIPPNPKFVLFSAHGSFKTVFQYFDRGPWCDKCYGLPENRVLVMDALREGYAVLTLQAIGDQGQSWPIINPEVDAAVELIKTWTRKHNLEQLPIVGLGYSSGGWFISSLAFQIRLKSIVMLNSQGDHRSLQVALPEQFPPTYFAQMNCTPADTLEAFDNTADVAESMAILESRGVPVFETLIFRKSMTPGLFLDRISCMSVKMAESICEALRAGGWLDLDDYLTHDPRLEDFRAVMVEWGGLPYCEEFGDLCFAEYVEEELKVASCKHAFTSDADGRIFAWLDSPDSSRSGSPMVSIL